MKNSPELDKSVATAGALRAAGKWADAVEESRRALVLFPRSAKSYRSLSYSLTHGRIYQNYQQLGSVQVDEGAFGQALDCSRTAMRLPDRTFEDFLQAGYCLTAMKRYSEASVLIRAATDMFCLAGLPAVFTDLNDSWEVLTPRFLIIGAAKAGTTSLYHHMCKHPKILPAVLKEVTYFSAPERGQEWYLAHFPCRPVWENRFYTGEACVANFPNSAAPLLVSQALPDVRLIALVRNPVDRAISHYYNDLRVGIETRQIDDAMEEELSYLDCPDHQRYGNILEYQRTQRNYIYLGLYALHLSNWRVQFSPDRLLVIVSEEINVSPRRELDRIFNHIGLKYQYMGEYANRLPGVYDEQPQGRVRARLEEFFAKPNEQLFEMLGRRLNWSGARGG